VNIVQTMPAIWVVLFAPVAGWLADRFGRRPILIWSMIVYALVGAAPFLMSNIYWILVTRCFVGICEAVVLVTTTAMIGDYFKGRSRERWLAGQTGLGSLSALGIIWLGGALGAVFGWHGPFLVYLYSLILVIGVVVFCWEPAHETPSEEFAHGADILYREIPKGRMAGICLVTIFGSLLFYTPITQNANAFVSLGVRDPAQIGQFSSLASLGVPIGTVIFWGVSRFKTAWLLAVEFALIGIGFVWMARSTTPMEYVWAANVQQIGCGLILPTMLVWGTRGLAYQIRGRATGLWQGAYAVGLFVSGATLTFMARAFGDGDQIQGMLPAFGRLGSICLIAAAVALAAALLWKRPAVQAATA
jgi:MFS family permease